MWTSSPRIAAYKAARDPTGPAPTTTIFCWSVGAAIPEMKGKSTYERKFQRTRGEVWLMMTCGKLHAYRFLVDGPSPILWSKIPLAILKQNLKRHRVVLLRRASIIIASFPNLTPLRRFIDNLGDRALDEQNTPRLLSIFHDLETDKSASLVSLKSTSISSQPGTPCHRRRNALGWIAQMMEGTCGVPLA